MGRRLTKRTRLRGHTFNRKLCSSSLYVETSSLGASLKDSSPIERRSLPLPPAQQRAALNSPLSPTTTFNGPLKVLQELGADDPFEIEEHDPIARQVITYGEATIAFKMYVGRQFWFDLQG